MVLGRSQHQGRLRMKYAVCIYVTTFLRNRLGHLTAQIRFITSWVYSTSQLQCLKSQTEHHQFAINKSQIPWSLGFVVNNRLYSTLAFACNFVSSSLSFLMEPTYMLYMGYHKKIITISPSA